MTTTNQNHIAPEIDKTAPKVKQLIQLGDSLIGTSAKSNLLSELDERGRKIYPSYKILSYEILLVAGEPELLLTFDYILDGATVFYEFCYGFSY